VLVAYLVGESKGWDAKVGMNFSNVTKYDDAKALPGFQLGVGMDYGFSESWSLQSGLLISSKGYKIEDVKVRPIYLDIPILPEKNQPMQTFPIQRSLKTFS
jgi:hypothetical protein